LNLYLNFFFGWGSEVLSKIHWIGWQTICLRKEDGGLGVRQLREFNLSLLGKWCWRLLVGRGGFWYRVLAARYGEEARRLEVGGRSVSCWWREVAKIRDEVGEEGEGWFAGMVSRKVGDGETTFFWLDRWVGDVPLCRRFSRLFNLAENKLASVASMCSLGWEVGGGAWQWRRRLWAWEEEMLVEYRTFLSNVFLQPTISVT